MSTSEASFKPPPVVECVSREVCLGIGKKIYSAEKVCSECLRCHDPEQLRCLADGNDQALAAIAEEVSWKQQIKANLESHDRFLCAFEDPDYELCRWRQKDLNLRGNRTNCSIVKRKGTACSNSSLMNPPGKTCIFGNICVAPNKTGALGPDICFHCRGLDPRILDENATTDEQNQKVEELRGDRHDMLTK
ncbi:hypothetical protein BDV96DRAFT_476721, partial [Lophiotrema nucula]